MRAAFAMIAGVFDGGPDLRHASEQLASRLPSEVRALARLAYNYHWSWQEDGASLFAEIDPERWSRVAKNPVRQLTEVSPEQLGRVAGEPSFRARLTAAQESLERYLARPPADSTLTPERPGAFFCAEFAVHVSLPIYSGGLGALAGDFLKQASDDALPLVGVGLLYRQGYFRQRIDADGRQQEHWTDTYPDRVPAALVRGEDGEPLTVSVPVEEEEVSLQIWRVDVGRVPLYLLDSERPENSPTARWITRRLYIGDPELRLAQYLLLGAGGVRALAAMGIDPARLHLNEGHAAFAALELARRERNGRPDADEALERASRRVIFTTHTPVPAGNDTYPLDQVARVAGAFAAETGVGVDRLAALARSHADGKSEPFGLTQFALHTSAHRNGVSRRHGEVAREMWHDLWPTMAVDQVPIDHVTNGVHQPTWIGPQMRALLDRHLGAGWLERSGDPGTWFRVADIPASELWAARNAQRARLVDAVRERSVLERLGRGDPLEYARAAAATFAPDVLTIGFARRIATYKRLRLLIADVEGAAELLSGPHPVQLVLAGKAHPRDEDGKAMLAALFELRELDAVAGRVVFLEDYDLDSAALLVRGCDVWLNLPRPPLEASGTSGMKSAVNGGLHLSVLDGWWAEAYDGTNGWALDGEVDEDPDAQDARDGAELRRILDDEVVPLFHERDDDGVPVAWIERIRASLTTIGPVFSAQRMLADYREREYGD
ncbi:MAG: alpha-glucan family phosphorylase [Solirubrobacteraceae bacterium]